MPRPVLRINGHPVRQHRRPVAHLDRGDGADQLFRWARFLDQGEGRSVSRHRAVEALIEAADHDRERLYQTRMYALRSLRQGVGTRGTVELIDAALDRTELPHAV
jgi:hypothetical protein